MKVFLISAFALMMGHFSAAEEKWTSLFNGKDLTGWNAKICGSVVGDNFQNTFRVEKGVLKVDYADYEQFDGHFGYLFSQKKYSRYRLRLEYRFVGKQVKGGPGWAFRNSGVMVHAEAPEGMAVDQDFPAAIEVQLLGGTGKGERTTANLCTPGTHVEINGKLDTRHTINSTSKTFNGDQWVNLEIEVHGNQLIRHLIDGKEVIAYSKPQLGGDAHADDLIAISGDMMLSEGYICLQSKSHPVEFRKIEILELPDEVASK